MKFLQRGILIFGIAFSEYTSAQTPVCSGDTVVLVLNGYKQGSVTWQQSLDKVTWLIAEGTVYNDSLIIIAATSLYYSVIDTDGSCSPFYSDTTLVTVRSVSPPTANPASNVTLLSFDANWSSVSGATTYHLDVATDAGFTSFVPGYQNLTVNNDTTYRVTGVSCKKIYYYRVRVDDDTCGKPSSNSDAIAVSIPTCPDYCTNESTCNGNIIDSRDSKNYKTVQIGSQCWMTQNLNVGKKIMGSLQQTQFDSLGINTIEKYCYNDTEDSCTKYGGLYLWDEMMAYGPGVGGNSIGPQGICPTGWHIPTDNEWKCLEMTIGMTKTQVDVNGYNGTTEGNKLKTIGKGAPPLWSDPSAGTNTSNFSALPSGVLSTAVFSGIGFGAWFWTATEADAANEWGRTLTNARTDVRRQAFPKVQYEYGYSVRCVKD